MRTFRRPPFIAFSDDTPLCWLVAYVSKYWYSSLHKQHYYLGMCLRLLPSGSGLRSNRSRQFIHARDCFQYPHFVVTFLLSRRRLHATLVWLFCSRRQENNGLAAAAKIGWLLYMLLTIALLINLHVRYLLLQPASYCSMIAGAPPGHPHRDQYRPVLSFSDRIRYSPSSLMWRRSAPAVQIQRASTNSN